MAHRPLTPEETVTMKEWEKKMGKRAASPGAPATGVCQDFLNGNCPLGASCSLQRPSNGPTPRAKGKAKAKAKADAQS